MTRTPVSTRRWTRHERGRSRRPDPVRPQPEPSPWAAGPSTAGELLRAARLAAGSTVEDVFERTRIRPAVLRALEADDTGVAGGTVYSRGHLRTAARAVGADPAPIVAAFDDRLGVRPAALPVLRPLPPPHAPSRGLGLPLPAQPDRRSPRWVTAGVGCLVVLVGLYTLGDLRGERAVRDTAAAAQTSAAASPGPDAAPAVPPPAAVAPPPPVEAVLVVQSTGRSWVGVKVAGGTVFDGTVEAGWSTRFADPEQVRLRVGNAAAVTASCGGAPAVPLGAEGAVLTVTCTKQGLAPT